MSVFHCFESGTVVQDLECTEKYRAISELIRKAPIFTEIADLDRFEKAVIEREKAQSTGFGHGIAVAHGRIEGIDRVLIAFGVSRKGISFESRDGKPVSLLFIIASPPHMSLDYLQALSTLVRILRDDSLRESLLSLSDAGEIERRIHGAFMTCLGKYACGTVA